MNDPNPTPEHRTTTQSLGAQEQLAREASSGQPARIGRFEIRRELGGGSFGTVYLAFDPNLNRDVALKVPIGVTAASREEFLREARATAGITHPNVCQVFDADTAGNVPFIVSRYVGGGTLADLLKRADDALPPLEAVEIVRKLALGVAAAHAKGIVHRDLKPGNILFDEENNEVLITDFGLAKLLAHASLSSAGVKGTPAYMSPEQFGDGQKSSDVGPLSDVYSLGVIFYELLTGQLPFTGNPFALMLAHIQTPPQPPSLHRRDLAPRLDALCLKALAKKPADRYAGAKDFANALADHVRPAPPAGPPPAVKRKSGPPPVPTKEELRARAEADYQRGEKYYYGDGVPQDYAKAREWYEMAAAQGHADAQFSIGYLYREGRGVPQDYTKAREWYEQAAAQGHANAQSGLGYLYANGYGVLRDCAKAREWYELAAAQGHANAQCNLGVLYEDGRGGPLDLRRALELYREAAGKGDEAAKKALSRLQRN